MSEHPSRKSHTARELLVLADILKDIEDILKDIEIPVSFPIAAWKIDVFLRQAASEIDGKDALIEILYQRLSERPEQFARELEFLQAEIQQLRQALKSLRVAAGWPPDAPEAAVWWRAAMAKALAVLGNQRRKGE